MGRDAVGVVSREGVVRGGLYLLKPLSDEITLKLAVNHAVNQGAAASTLPLACSHCLIYLFIFWMGDREEKGHF